MEFDAHNDKASEFSRYDLFPRNGRDMPNNGHEPLIGTLHVLYLLNRAVNRLTPLKSKRVRFEEGQYYDFGSDFLAENSESTEIIYAFVANSKLMINIGQVKVYQHVNPPPFRDEESQTTVHCSNFRLKHAYSTLYDAEKTLFEQCRESILSRYDFSTFENAVSGKTK